MMRIPNKDNVLTHIYKKVDGTELRFSKVRDMILELLCDDDIDMSPTDITTRLGFQHRQLTHILPYLVNLNILSSYRATGDQLRYTRRKPCMLQEAFYSTDKLDQLLSEGKIKIKSRFIHRVK
jgi:predicted HTH transcriptional regulator